MIILTEVNTDTFLVVTDTFLVVTNLLIAYMTDTVMPLRQEGAMTIIVSSCYLQSATQSNSSLKFFQFKIKISQ